MTLAELRQARAAAGDQLKAHAEAGGAEYDTALKSFDDSDASIKRMEEAEARNAKTAQPLETPEGTLGRVEPQANAPMVKGAKLSRCIVSLAATKGIASLAAEFAAKRWGGADGEEIAKALSSSLGASGGFLVPQDMAADVIEFLRPASAVMQMNPRTIEMPHGSYTLPGIAAGATAAYVSENTDMTKTEQTFRDVKLIAKKLAALVPISNDMIRYPSASVDNLVKEDLAGAIAMRMDLAFIRGDGTQDTPRGLLNYAKAVASNANYITANTTVSLANATTDLGKLRLAVRAANVAMRRPGWIMSTRTENYLMTVLTTVGVYAFREEMLGGKLWGYPYAVTTQIPENLGAGSDSEVYFADFNEFIIGDAMALEISVFDGAAYYDGSAVVSGVSRDQTVIRAIVQHDTGIRQDAAAAVLNTVRWA